jgi:two-component system CheB/CheR fusion protein
MPVRSKLGARLDLWVPAAYVIASSAWIAGSDLLLARVYPAEELTSWSILKGLGFVVVTGLGLHAGLRWALTRERTAHRRVQASEQKYRAFFENLRELVIVFEAVRDDRGHVAGWEYREANRAALERLGAGRGAAGDGHAIEARGPPARAFVTEGWSSVLETGEPVSCELTVWDRCYLQSVFRLDENTVASAAIDITDRNRAERELRVSDERKSSFFAMLSHELRNPLAPMRHALWLLDRAEPGTEQATRARETLARQVLHLTRITDDLVDVTRISRGRIRLQTTRTDLIEVVRRAVQDHEVLFGARKVSLTAELGTLPIWIDADPTRIGQAIGNLLSNAAKFTEDGGHVAICADRGSGGSAVVRVRDDGIGIPANLIGDVFEPFVQGDTSLDRARGGLGLGLSVVKALVELHGGRVEARSEGPGRGAEFTMSLPLAPEEPTLLDPKRPAREPMRRHRVLVVEDNVDAAETLREMLLLWGQEVEVAHDGREGVEKARAWRPDVILCDIGLPIMDGYAVARAIRSAPELSSAFLIALTGYTSAEDQRNAATAGFDRHLGKPVPVETLEDVLATAVG